MGKEIGATHELGSEANYTSELTRLPIIGGRELFGIGTPRSLQGLQRAVLAVANVVLFALTRLWNASTALVASCRSFFNADHRMISASDSMPSSTGC